MAKEKAKKAQDNRDVFEKALDYAPAIGATLGAAAGATAAGRKAYKSTKKWGEKNNWSKKDSGEIARREAYIIAPVGGFAGGAAGAFAGGVVRASSGNKRRK